MGFTRITDEVMKKYPGVMGQETVPKLSVTEMQAAFEQRAEKVLRPAHDTLCEELEATTAAANLGAQAPDGVEAANNLQAILNALAAQKGGLTVKKWDPETATLELTLG